MRVPSWVYSLQITVEPKHLSARVALPRPSRLIALLLRLRSAVAKDKDKQSFKLRAGMDKKIVIYVQQTSNKELAIERYVSADASKSRLSPPLSSRSSASPFVFTLVLLLPGASASCSAPGRT